MALRQVGFKEDISYQGFVITNEVLDFILRHAGHSTKDSPIDEYPLFQKFGNNIKLNEKNNVYE